MSYKDPIKNYPQAELQKYFDLSVRTADQLKQTLVTLDAFLKNFTTPSNKVLIDTIKAQVLQTALSLSFYIDKNLDSNGNVIDDNSHLWSNDRSDPNPADPNNLTLTEKLYYMHQRFNQIGSSAILPKGGIVWIQNQDKTQYELWLYNPDVSLDALYRTAGLDINNPVETDYNKVYPLYSPNTTGGWVKLLISITGSTIATLQTVLDKIAESNKDLSNLLAGTTGGTPSTEVIELFNNIVRKISISLLDFAKTNPIFAEGIRIGDQNNGYKIDKDGNAVFNNINLKGDVDVAGTFKIGDFNDLSAGGQSLLEYLSKKLQVMVPVNEYIKKGGDPNNPSTLIMDGYAEGDLILLRKAVGEDIPRKDATLTVSIGTSTYYENQLRFWDAQQNEITIPTSTDIVYYISITEDIDKSYWLDDDHTPAKPVYKRMQVIYNGLLLAANTGGGVSPVTRQEFDKEVQDRTQGDLSAIIRELPQLPTSVNDAQNGEIFKLISQNELYYFDAPSNASIILGKPIKELPPGFQKDVQTDVETLMKGFFYIDPTDGKIGWRHEKNPGDDEYIEINSTRAFDEMVEKIETITLDLEANTSRTLFKANPPTIPNLLPDTVIPPSAPADYVVYQTFSSKYDVEANTTKLHLTVIADGGITKHIDAIVINDPNDWTTISPESHELKGNWQALKITDMTNIATPYTYQVRVTGSAGDIDKIKIANTQITFAYTMHVVMSSPTKIISEHEAIEVEWNRPANALNYIDDFGMVKDGTLHSKNANIPLTIDVLSHKLESYILYEIGDLTSVKKDAKGLVAKSDNQLNVLKYKELLFMMNTNNVGNKSISYQIVLWVKQANQMIPYTIPTVPMTIGGKIQTVFAPLNEKNEITIVPVVGGNKTTVKYPKLWTKDLYIEAYDSGVDISKLTPRTV